MKNLKFMLALLLAPAFILSACGKKQAPQQPAANPKACTQKCPDGEDLAKDCSCAKHIPPQAFTPDAAMQLKLINSVLNNDVSFIKQQLDNNMHVNAYLSLDAADNILDFRDSLKTNYSFLYDNIRKDTKDLTLLFLSVAANKQAVFDEIMAHNPDVGIPSFGNVTPYKMALINRDSAKAQALLDKGAKTDLTSSGDKNDLANAIQNKDFKMASILIAYAHNKGIDTKSVLPTLSKAVSTGNSDLVSFLLGSARQAPDYKDDGEDNYPITAALLNKNIDISRTLLAAGANIDIQDYKGRTPLMICIDDISKEQDQAKDSMRSTISFIIESGAAVNSRDKKGQSAMFYAVRQGDFKIIEMLSEQGADLNIKDSEGETPIFIPAKSGDISLAKELIKLGALTKIKDRHGLAPATYAVQNGYMDTYDLLQGAKK